MNRERRFDEGTGNARVETSGRAHRGSGRGSDGCSRGRSRSCLERGFRGRADPGQYFDRVAAICRVYGPKLDRIPPPDASGTGDVVAAIRVALPLVKGQEREVRALDAPSGAEESARAMVRPPGSANRDAREGAARGRPPGLSRRWASRTSTSRFRGRRSLGSERLSASRTRRARRNRMWRAPRVLTAAGRGCYTRRIPGSLQTIVLAAERL